MVPLPYQKPQILPTRPVQIRPVRSLPWDHRSDSEATQQQTAESPRQDIGEDREGQARAQPGGGGSPWGLDTARRAGAEALGGNKRLRPMGAPVLEGFCGSRGSVYVTGLSLPVASATLAGKPACEPSAHHRSPAQPHCSGAPSAF